MRRCSCPTTSTGRIRGVEFTIDATLAGWDVGAQLRRRPAQRKRLQRRQLAAARPQHRPHRPRPRVRRVRFGATLNGAGARYDDAANTVRLGGFATTDLRFEYAFDADWTLQARDHVCSTAIYETVASVPPAPVANSAWCATRRSNAAYRRREKAQRAGFSGTPARSVDGAGRRQAHAAAGGQRIDRHAAGGLQVGHGRRRRGRAGRATAVTAPCQVSPSARDRTIAVGGIRTVVADHMGAAGHPVSEGWSLATDDRSFACPGPGRPRN